MSRPVGHRARPRGWAALKPLALLSAIVVCGTSHAAVAGVHEAPADLVIWLEPFPTSGF